MDSIAEDTPDPNQGTSTNDHIADINNLRLDIRVSVGQLRKASESPLSQTDIRRSQGSHVGQIHQMLAAVERCSVVA